MTSQHHQIHLPLLRVLLITLLMMMTLACQAEELERTKAELTAVSRERDSLASDNAVLKAEIAELRRENTALKETDREYFKRAQAEEAAGSIQEAISTFEKIPQLFPQGEFVSLAKKSALRLRQQVEQAALQKAMESAKDDVLGLVEKELNAQLNGGTCGACWAEKAQSHSTFKNLSEYAIESTFRCGDKKKILGVVVRTRAQNGFGGTAWTKTEFLAGLESGGWRLIHMGEQEDMDICMIAGIAGIFNDYK